MHIPPNWGIFFPLLASFLIFWLLFSRVFVRPFLNLLNERERRLKELNDRAGRLLEEAGTAESRREQELAEFRREALGRREAARREAEQEGAKLLEDARVQARETVQRVRQQLESDLLAAQERLEEFGQRLAVDLAQQLLRRDLNGSAKPRSANN